jgi:hypothetical protein
MKIRDLTDAISINPTNVQRDTLVDQLFKRREYRPPWLWSVVEALTHLRGYGKRVICKPTGGGTPRGAHNCGACDGVFLGAIQDYSLGKADRLDEVSCGCRQRWEDYTAAEDLLATSVDIEALLSSTQA